MAWITGKIQKDRRRVNMTTQVGNPVAYERDGIWYSSSTGKELKLIYAGNLKEFLEREKEDKS